MADTHKKRIRFDHPIERLTTWIGSISSLITHTIVFTACGLVGFFGIAPWDTVLLVLTTLVSLEAIYLAIFIQITVNRHTKELEIVSEDIEEITVDVEEIQEDIEEITEDVEEIQEDVEEISEGDQKDAVRKKKQIVTLEQLTSDVRRMLQDLESLKKD